MTEITFIRHGQANSSAKTEDGYDNLSPLGRTQAELLGQHLKFVSHTADHVFTGTLRRQKDTQRLLDLSADTPVTRDARVNEIEYYTLSQQMNEQFGTPFPNEGITFTDHFYETFARWQNGEIKDAPEPYETYESRVKEQLEEWRHVGPHVTVVTSGGIIAMALGHVLNLDQRNMINCLLAGVNTGVTKINYMHGEWFMTQMNATPHLEHPQRLDMRTFY